MNTFFTSLFLLIFLLCVSNTTYAKDEPGAISQKDGKYYVSLNGKTVGGPYDLVLQLTFSPDLKSIAYIAQEGEKQFVYLDGKRINHYEPMDFDGPYVPFFSPDAKQLAYFGKILASPAHSEKDKIKIFTNKIFLVLNGKKGKEFDFIMGVVYFSPDSQKVAYIATLGKEMYAVINEELHPLFSLKDKESEEYAITEVPFFRILFSSDSQSVTYPLVKKTGKKFQQAMMLNGKAGKFYDAIRNAAFSKDGKSLIYEAVLGNQKMMVKEKVR